MVFYICVKYGRKATELNMFFRVWVAYLILGNVFDSVVHWRQAEHFLEHSGYSTILSNFFSMVIFYKEDKKFLLPLF